MRFIIWICLLATAVKSTDGIPDKNDCNVCTSADNKIALCCNACYEKSDSDKCFTTETLAVHPFSAVTGYKDICGECGAANQPGVTCHSKLFPGCNGCQGYTIALKRCSRFNTQESPECSKIFYDCMNKACFIARGQLPSTEADLGKVCNDFICDKDEDVSSCAVDCNSDDLPCKPPPSLIEDSPCIMCKNGGTLDVSCGFCTCPEGYTGIDCAAVTEVNATITGDPHVIQYISNIQEQLCYDAYGQGGLKYKFFSQPDIGLIVNARLKTTDGDNESKLISHLHITTNDVIIQVNLDDVTINNKKLQWQTQDEVFGTGSETTKITTTFTTMVVQINERIEVAVTKKYNHLDFFLKWPIELTANTNGILGWVANNVETLTQEPHPNTYVHLSTGKNVNVGKQTKCFRVGYSQRKSFINMDDFLVSK
ncbi:unnamed protein product [Owenia fusiformis]|uniref:Uncharacterized protein n=1 Tax=Owenia fusiformis TaxID=6347 RepID=A0A8J1Y1L8_OWEFU|nr:unnamed protein product [Owenia fusiformis]